MKHVSLDRLQSAIIKPGFDKHLVPLLHFKGHADLGRVHRKWNLMVSMLEHECETLGEGVSHLHLNADRAQLCLPPNRVDRTGMYGFMSRLLLKPQVTNEHPGLLDYVRFLMPRGPWDLVAVSPIATDRRHAWWRAMPKAEPRRFQLRERPAALAYPYLVHDGGREEHDLLRLINAAVPREIMGDLRADICQDLAVGVLCGDFSKDDLGLPAREIIKRMRKAFPAKYGPLSLDALIQGTDGLRLIDTI